jgi:phosphopantothenoylcysteine synthetase/decarboxylase
LNPSTPEAEKAAVLVVHELLSLTSEKKILVDHLTHFRRDFKFSQRIRAMLIRHPEYFYVSLKGTRDSVFLREAYDNTELKEKDPLVLLKERMAELVAKGIKDEMLDALSDDEDGDEDGEEDGDDDHDEDDEDWDEDDDEERLVGSLGDVSARTSRERLLQTAEKVATPPREVW